MPHVLQASARTATFALPVAESSLSPLLAQIFLRTYLGVQDSEQ